MNASQLYQVVLKQQEAQAVRLGIPVERKYSDAELAGSIRQLEDAERELYGKAQLVDECGRKLRAFDITVTTSAGVETMRMLAPDSISANIRAVELLFGDCFEAEKPQSFKIDVRPVQSLAELKRAA